MRRSWLVAVLALGCLTACSAQGRIGGAGASPGGEPDFLPIPTDSPSPTPSASPAPTPQAGCSPSQAGCYTVYAHDNHTLYRMDLTSKQLISLGDFNAPTVGSGEDVMTDLAVAPDDTIYVISKTNLYVADPSDGHVTLLGPVTACGTYTVALTTLPSGDLLAADFKGAICKIDLSTTPITVTQLGSLGQGMAISGDLVAVADGTLYGTAYRLSDSANEGTQLDNLLVTLDSATGAVLSTRGATGYARLYATAFAGGHVFGFTHDGSGQVVTLDPVTGAGVLYNTFKDANGDGIAFSGAGVNSQVALIP